MPDDPSDPSDDDSRRPALIGLLLVLVLVVVSYFLVVELRHQSQLQDCLMAGRRNCAPIEVPPTNR